MSSPVENMKHTKTKPVKLFRMLNITEQQFEQAKAWYHSAKQKPPHQQNTYPFSRSEVDKGN